MSAREFLSVAVMFLAIMCLMLDVQSGAGVGKQAKKRNYVLQMTKMDQPYVDPEWVAVKGLKITKYNRTTPVMKGTITFKKDIPDTVLCSVQSYQQMGGGNYGKGPIALADTSLCKFIENDTVMYPSFRKSTNLPKSCPLKKMDVKVINYNINDANLPPELPPPNEWIGELNMTNKATRKTMLSLRVYLTIKRDGNIGATG